MRDFDKVQEQEGFSLSLQQVYAALGAAVVMMGLVFAGGYTLGKQSVVPAVAAEDPLVPADVQNESVAMLLARAAEEGVDPAEQEKLELQFHSILPSRTGEDAEAPRPGEKPAAHTVASGEAKGEPKKEGAESAGAKNPTSGDAADAKTAAAKALKPEAAGEKAVASKESASKESASKESASKESASKESASKESASKELASKEAGAKDSRAKDPSSKDPASKDGGTKDSSTKTAKGTVGAGTDGSAKTAVKAGVSEPAKSEKTATKTTDKSTNQKAAADPGTSKNTGKGFTVQVSSYQEAGVADKLVRQLMAQGFTAYRVEAEVNGQKWYRVRIGSFENQEGAEKEVQRLKAARSELKPMIAHK